MSVTVHAKRDGVSRAPGALGSQAAGTQVCPNRRELLRRFLNAYWLRPENAFWMTIRSETLAHAPWGAPALDLCCGDGVFSFLHAGGVLEDAFDVFLGARDSDRGPDQRADMFDYDAPDYQPQLVRAPEHHIHTGLDLKPALLAKAERLGFYDRLVEHDSNHHLPFPDDSFQTVYCNAAYWLTNIDGFLAEVHRITRRGGRVILQVKLDSMRRYNLEVHRAQLGDRFLEIIARGRVACWPSLCDQATWEARFAQTGLRIEQATPFITKTHAQVWDVGLRPIAPLLVRMANRLTPTDRAAIKADWVSLLSEIVVPFCDPAFELGLHGEAAEVQYVLAV